MEIYKKNITSEKTKVYQCYYKSNDGILSEVLSIYYGSQLIWPKDTDKFTITVNVQPANYGTVEGQGIYKYGKTITLTAKPKSGYIFTKWDDESTNAAKEITVTENKTLTAYFEEDIKEGTITYHSVY